MADIEAAREAEAEGATFEYHADNEEILAAFLALRSQWRIVSGFDKLVFQGLDYASVLPTLILLGITRARREEVFRGLQIMEFAALPLLNVKPDKDG